MNNEIITRRDFFKKAASKTLPILIGASSLPLLFSCNKDDEELLEAIDREEGGGSNNCSGSSCSSSCSSGCSSSCYGSCSGSSSSSTCSSCSSTRVRPFR